MASTTSLSAYDLNIAGGIHAELSGYLCRNVDQPSCSRSAASHRSVAASSSVYADLLDNLGHVDRATTPASLVAGQAVSFGSSGCEGSIYVGHRAVAAARALRRR